MGTINIYKDMEKEFVPFDLAVRLKRVFFNEQCFAYYQFDGKLQMKSSNTFFGVKGFDVAEDQTLAPLWQQVFDFFMREYGLVCEMRFSGRTYSRFTHWNSKILNNATGLVGRINQTHFERGEENEGQMTDFFEDLSYEDCRERSLLMMLNLIE